MLRIHLCPLRLPALLHTPTPHPHSPTLATPSRRHRRERMTGEEEEEEKKYTSSFFIQAVADIEGCNKTSRGGWWGAEERRK